MRSPSLQLASTGPTIVAIDAPLDFPEGMCCLEESHSCRPVRPAKGSACDRELARCGIAVYCTTKRSITKGMVYRAIRLFRDLSAQGRGVLHVYTYTAMVLLFGRPIPKKSSKEGLEFLVRHLGRRIGSIDICTARFDHDLCDALLAAYVSYLASQDLTEALDLRAGPHRGAQGSVCAEPA